MNPLPGMPENFTPLPDYLREQTALVYALCDEQGQLLDANRGFLALGRLESLPARPWNAAPLFVNPPFTLLAGPLAEDDIAYRGILNIGPLDAVHSVHGTVYRRGNQLLLVAEHDVQEQARLNRSVIELNEEMAQIERDLVRKNQLLAQAQSQLVQAEKMACVGQLAAGAAHEINNPIGFVHSNLISLEGYLRDLFAILDGCEQMERAVPGEASAVKLSALRQELDLDFLRQDIPLLLGESREGIARVKNIVQHLRDFTRIDSNDDWHWENPQRCLDNTLEVLRGTIPNRIAIVREYGETPEIECLPAQLNQAFMNILLNATQAIEGAGTIHLRTGQTQQQVWVEIADSGHGIAADTLPRIFEPFFTTRPVGSGAGLGLSAAFNIVERHHGRIEAESTPGKGAVVRIRLPVRRAHD